MLYGPCSLLDISDFLLVWLIFGRGKTCVRNMEHHVRCSFFYLFWCLIFHIQNTICIDMHWLQHLQGQPNGG